MRTFEYHGARSHKFWSIDARGSSFVATHGKVGTSGKIQTKTFASAEKAQAAADKLIRQKTGKGYVETTPLVATAEAVAFERALAENPDDVAGWCAYADYLAEQGSPRGEFMLASTVSSPRCRGSKSFTCYARTTTARPCSR